MNWMRNTLQFGLQLLKNNELYDYLNIKLKMAKGAKKKKDAKAD